MEFKQFIETQLNESQKAAVNPKDGIFQVIAGAGSGKTRVITSRIANLMLQHNVDKDAIVALTFTNKAGNEMKERILRWLPAGDTTPFIGTFHSFCLKLLKQYLGYNFTIMDADDQQKLLSNIIKKFDLKKRFTPKNLSYAISLIKNNQIAPTGDEFNEPIMHEIYKTYEAEKAQAKCLDFDDLIVETVRLFRRNPAFKEKFQASVKHILIDEYQDTSTVQHELLKEMTFAKDGSLTTDSICIVGDEDQSIYSWRGATANNIINFKDDYPAAKRIKIEQNYRSVHPILQTANLVIKNNKNRNEKNLWSEKKANNRILKVKCMSDYQESDIVIEAIKAAQQKKSAIAILYRTHFQSRVIEESLIKSSIPYTIVGGIQFYERKEVKDILAYLKLIVNPFDKISLSRIINTPNRKLGDKFQEYFDEEWAKQPLLNFKQLSEKIIAESLTQNAKVDALQSFCAAFDGLDQAAKPSVAINQIIKKIEYFTFIKDSYEGREADDRVDNVKELIRAAEHMEELEAKTVSTFLEEVALMQDKLSNKKEKDAHVKLMTLHAAKGLEFDIVIISGLEEGLLPSSRSMENPEDIEEERRLFYVGITRAKEYLILTHSNYRNTFGQTNTQAESRFLDEAMSHLITQEDCSSWSKFSFKEKLSQFLGTATTFSEHVQTFRSFIPAQAKKQPTIEKPKPTENLTFTSTWKVNQPVTHPTFGIGIVQSLENRAGKIFLTIRFKAGIKKIDSSFVTKS